MPDCESHDKGNGQQKTDTLPVSLIISLIFYLLMQGNRLIYLLRPVSLEIQLLQNSCGLPGNGRENIPSVFRRN